MLIEIFILFQFITVALFVTSFLTKQEILYTLTVLFSALLMKASINIQVVVNNGLINVKHPYLSWLNLIFLALALIFGIFDLFDKYGKRMHEDETTKF